MVCWPHFITSRTETGAEIMTKLIRQSAIYHLICFLWLKIKAAAVRSLSGGILGGITTGMPLIFSTAIKPTPSISLPQQSISLSAKEHKTLEIIGRHDPCIVPRAVPFIEAAAAIAVFDAYIGL